MDKISTTLENLFWWCVEEVTSLLKKLMMFYDILEFKILPTVWRLMVERAWHLCLSYIQHSFIINMLRISNYFYIESVKYSSSLRQNSKANIQECLWFCACHVDRCLEYAVEYPSPVRSCERQCNLWKRMILVH